jgi:PBSX family phage terminase large subunit
MDYGITPVFYKNYTAFTARNDDGSKKYKYIINTGGSRSSKTWSLLELMHQICNANPNVRTTAWRDTKKDCRDTIWEDYQKILKISNRFNPLLRNKTEATYSFPHNNSRLEFHGTDDEEKVHGLTQNVAWINEPYKISESTFDQIDMRSEVIFIDWNPKKNHWIDKLSKRDNAIVIHSTFKDNPFCPPQMRNKILSYENTPYNLEQGTADEYMWQVYGLGLKSEKPNRIYKNWKTITDEDFDNAPYNSYYGLDFGAARPTAMVEVKFDGKESFLIKQRIYLPSQEMGCSLSELMAKIGIDKKIPNICDSAEPESINELRLNGFNAIPAIKGQGSVNSGIKFIQKFNIFYTESSLAIEDEYYEYEWEIINGVNLDRPVKRNDHILDAIRYITTYLQYYLRIQK